MKKLQSLMLWTALFIAIFGLFYVMHVRYFKVDVVLYSALFDGLAASSLTFTALVLWSKRHRILTRTERIQIFIIWILIASLLSLAVPTILDRSLSFYILEKIQQKGGGLHLDGFESMFKDEYMIEYRLVDVRLTEQFESGTLRLEGHCVQLTEFGRRLASFSHFFRLHFLPKQRLLREHYSDDLTDPFKNGVEVVEYRCPPHP
jgi:hypothetical protein